MRDRLTRVPSPECVIPEILLLMSPPTAEKAMGGLETPLLSSLTERLLAQATLPCLRGRSNSVQKVIIVHLERFPFSVRLFASCFGSELGLAQMPGPG